MSKSFVTIAATLAATVAHSATFTVGYPSGYEADDFINGFNHILVAPGLGTFKAVDGKISLAFGAALITVTNSTGYTMPTGDIWLQVDRPGADVEGIALPDSVSELKTVRINLGTPIVADADAYCASQNLTALGVFSVGVTAAATIAAALAAGVADVPRNVVAAWTTEAIVTITGTDELGDVIVESSASGTSFAGKKAFKTVTGISVSANVTALTVGTGDVLGLPIFVKDANSVLKELQDGAAPTAGTLVVGSLAAPTATTGDVRGTYDPNAAADGSKAFALIVAQEDVTFRGKTNFAG